MRPVSVILIVLLLHCGTTLQNTIVINPRHAEYEADSVLVLPFEDKNKAPYNVLLPDAAVIMRDSFETALIRTGLQIGRLLDAKAVIFGIVTGFVQGARTRRTRVNWRKLVWV